MVSLNSTFAPNPNDVISVPQSNPSLTIADADSNLRSSFEPGSEETQPWSVDADLAVQLASGNIEPEVPDSDASESNRASYDTVVRLELDLNSKYQKSMSDDAVGAFFKEMARYPLLKAEEEVELANQVCFLNNVEALKIKFQEETGGVPTREQVAEALGITPQELKRKLRDGEVAKRTMIRSNLRLVVSIAKRYLNRGVPFLDLIQEGALGLNRATEKFDPEKGYKFSTYAYWWIRQGITRTIANDARTIRLPIHIVEKLNKLKKTHRELRRNLNRNPTEAELAEALNLSLENVRNLQQVRRQSLSLNHRVGKGEDTELLELLEDGTTRSPETQMSDSMMRQEIAGVLTDVLTEREKEIIALRYGLTTGEPRTLEEVGRVFSLSRERVRQIQTKAMRKLRRPQVASRLRGWLVES
ncbi:MAG: RNA polymerase sigma factor, RpoD/SigA family [Cyanobacteria bacterium P01_F01_bin.150]